MAGINDQFSHNPNNNYFGLVSGSASALPFPTGLVAKLFRLKADPGNIGTFKIGSSTFIVEWPLDAGDDTGWVAAPNSPMRGLSEFYYSNPSGTVDRLHYWIQR